MTLGNEIGRGLSLKNFASWVSVLTVLFAFGLASTASAVVTTKTYNLATTTTGSNLFTEISSATEYFKGTGEEPSWLDGSLSTPSVSYGTDAPAVTLNTVTFEFANGDGTTPADGAVTITAMDFYHDIDAGIPDLMDILGKQDSTLSGATGVLTGTTVVWDAGTGNDLTGEVHNELGCFKIVPLGICGAAAGLPEDGDTMVTHQTASTGVIELDNAASPNAASQSTVFNFDFSRLNRMESTIADAEETGRQFYTFEGDEVGTEVPLSSTPMQLLIVALMALTGLYAVNSEKITRLVRGQG